MFKTIKFGFQRMFRGYSDDIMWDFSDYFGQFIPPLKEFCEKNMPQNESENPERTEIYRKTLELIDDFEKMTCRERYAQPNAESELWKFVGANIGWYWD